MPLKLTARTIDGITVLSCAGRIVFGDEASQLREEVKKRLAENNRLVLDLGEVTYIDSGGIGTLVGLFTTARSNGGDMKLAHLTKRVNDLLQITKLITVFENHDSVDSAVKAFAAKAAK